MHVNKIQLWFKNGKLNKISSSYLYPNKKTCPPVQLNNKQLTQTEEVKYLGYILTENFFYSFNQQSEYNVFHKLMCW